MLGVLGILAYLDDETNDIISHVKFTLVFQAHRGAGIK